MPNTNSTGPLFHFAPLRLGSGSLIQPGNFGRIIRRYEATETFSGWRLARELIFEDQRPDYKPSRFNSCFGLPTHQDAEAYRRFNDPNFFQVLHEVEIVNPTLPTHTASLSWIEFPESGPFLDLMRLQAKQYWAGEPGDSEKGIETLSASEFRIIRCLE